MKINFKVLKGHILGIIFLTLITTTVSIIKGIDASEFKYDTTVFMTIGHEYNTESDLSAYETIHAADSFKETVQGWFKNPILLEKIYLQSGANPSLSARNQEKQNIIVTYSTKDAESAERIGESIESVLTEEIDTYNNSTNSKFTLSLYDFVTTNSPDKMLVYILFGIFSGLILGLFISFVYESVVTSFSKQSLLQRLLR